MNLSSTTPGADFARNQSASNQYAQTISIVVPVYFNEQSLPPLFVELREVERALNERELGMELIFVDDGSGDNSLRELLKIKEARPETRIIKLTRNFGSVHASKTGFHFVTGDCFTILPADLQDPPALVLEMVQHWVSGSKYVVCARAERDDPATAKLFSALYYWLLRVFVVSDFPEGGYDVALMDKQFLPHLQNSSKNIFTPLYAYWLGFKPVVLKYQRRKRLHGRSRWTFAKRLQASFDALLGFSIVPIRMITFIGLLVALTSFVYGGWIVFNGLLGRMDVRGFSTVVVLISFLQGVTILILGVIGEYVWRIFDETSKRPESVIDEIF